MCEELSDFEQTIPTMEKKQSNDELKGFQRLLKNIKKCGLSLVVTDTGIRISSVHVLFYCNFELLCLNSHMPCCENLEKEINTYIVNNLPDQGDRINDFFKMESTGVKVTEYTNITNENGVQLALTFFKRSLSLTLV